MEKKGSGPAAPPIKLPLLRFRSGGVHEPKVSRAIRCETNDFADLETLLPPTRR
jgi:hypothetical protein